MRNLKLNFAVLAGFFLIFSHVTTLGWSISHELILGEQDSMLIIDMLEQAGKLKDINYKEARLEAIAALREARKTSSNYLLQRALSINALLDWYNGEHEHALEKSFEGLALVRASGDSAAIASRYLQIGLIHLYTSDYDSSLKYHEKALDYFIGLNDTTNIIKAYGFIGKVHIFRGDYVKGKEVLLSSVVYRRKFKTDNWSIISSPESKEIINKYYTESLVNARNSLMNLQNEKSPTTTKRFTYHNIGLAYLMLGRPDSALYYFKNAAAVANELGIDPFWNELARAYVDLNMNDSAIWATKKALANALDHGTRINMAISYSSLARTYEADGNYKEAIAEYKKSLKLDQEMNHRRSQMNTMNWIAQLELDLNDNGIALAYADSSLQLAKEIGARHGYIEAQKIRAQIFERKNDYRTALTIISDYDSLFHLLQQGKTQLELARMDLYNEVELNQLEISDLNQQQRLAKANLQNRTLTMIIVLIISAFIALLLVLNYIRTIKLIKLNKVLKEQQEVISNQYDELTASHMEKEALLGEIHHRVKNNLQVISSLLSVQRLQLSDDSARLAVMEGQNRVQTMGLIHESLYQNDSFAKIEMQVYFEKLANNLISSFGYYDKDIALVIDAPGVNLDVDLAMNIGLVTNELVTNALKHAFDGYDREKEIIIALHQLKDDELTLRVQNNGYIDDDKINSEKANSFGLKLIKQIIKKYNGEVTFRTSDKTSVSIELYI